MLAHQYAGLGAESSCAGEHPAIPAAPDPPGTASRDRV